MRKGEFVRQQGDAPVRQTVRGAVCRIAHDRTAGRRQLGADLMTPAGLQAHLQQAAGVRGGQQAVVQNGLLTGLGPAVGRDPAIAAAAHEAVGQPGVRGGGTPLDHGQIGFGNGAFAELVAQAGGGLGSPRNDQHARHRRIQAMHHARENTAGLGMAHFEPLAGQIEQVGLILVVALHSQSRWFIEHQQMIVFVKDGPTRMKKKHETVPSSAPQKGSGRTRAPRQTEQPGPRAMAAIFEACGILLTARQIEQFWIYHGLLRRHNTLLNLTRIHNFSNMVLKLYVDSVLPDRLTALPSPLMDLGSGPGMPGIPLKIMRPDLEIRLAEGRAKRCAFLQEAAATLGLEGIRVVERNITPAFEEDTAGVITRAVETIAETLARVHGCLRHKGRVVFMKGPGCGPEIAEATARWGAHYALIEDHSYSLGRTSHQRRLVVFERLDAPPRIIVAQAARRYSMQEITSDQNDRYKALSKLLSSRGIKKAGQALLSGGRPIAEMLSAFPERCLAWISSGDQPPPESAPPNLQWLRLSDPLFQALDLFGTRHPLLCIQVPPIAAWSPEEGFEPGCSLLIPFQDPENVGAVIRSAAAFDITRVILLAESAHPYHPKALRASGGTVPRVRLCQGPSLHSLPRDLPILPLSSEGMEISTVDFPPAFGLLLGSEGEGIPAQWREAAVRIPIQPTVESLNAAAAATVALYEWRRREREVKTQP